METMTWNIEGVSREAVVYKSATVDAPIMIMFHGHGGVASGFALKKLFHNYWSQATFIYPQGLRTISGGDKDGSETGWQHRVGEVNNHTGIKDQDLKFFIEIVKSFTTVTPPKIGIHGFSNGGEFLYDVLWTVNGGMLSAIVGASAVLNTATGKTPIPVMHVAGKTDPVVPFTSQSKAFNLIKTLNQCNTTGYSYSTGDPALIGTRYSSKIHKSSVFVSYLGGHEYPNTAPKMITTFLRNKIKVTI